MPICPSCRGKKQLLTHLNYGGHKPNDWKLLACTRCGGTGEVSEEALHQHTQGRQLRTCRLRLNLSQRQAAALHGISPSTWSKMEQGLHPLPEGLLWELED